MAENKDVKPFAISKTLLLSVYGIIPVLLVLTAIDFYFWNSFLKNVLGLNATTAPLYVLFLELPHIISSFVSYADSEYLTFYKRNLLMYLPALLFATAVLISINIELAFVLYLAYTMYHAIKQQTGIAKMFVGNVTAVHTLWSIAGIFGAIIGNFIIFAPNILPTYFSSFSPLFILTAGVTLLAAGSFFYLYKLPALTIGWLYVLFTTLMLFGSYFFILIGYFFFAVFVIRFVHDTTAFIFYAVHDGNRNVEKNKNLVYMFFRPLHIPLLLVTPAFGIIVAYILQKYGVTFSQSASVVILLGVIHYYIESFMWKRESVHRKQLRFVD